MIIKLIPAIIWLGLAIGTVTSEEVSVFSQSLAQFMCFVLLLVSAYIEK